MRIEDSNVQNLNSPATRKLDANRFEAGYGKVQDADASGSSGATDTLELSSLSSAIRSQSEDSPERAAKLDPLAKDFSSGRYHPDSREISKKIIGDASLFGLELW